jgi:flavodoxin
MTVNIKKILVVYYSRTGITKKVANTIRDNLECDLEEISDKKNRSGILGWLSAGRDAGRKSLTELIGISKDPSNYDLVIIGSPTWNDTVSTPIRTYIDRFKGQLTNVALFTTQLSLETSTLRDMENLLEVNPIATIALNKKSDMESGDYLGKVDEFLSDILMS